MEPSVGPAWEYVGMKADRPGEVPIVGIALEPLRVEHADEMSSVLADSALYEFTGGDPPSRDALTERYRAQVAGPGRSEERWHNWIVRRTDSDEPFGFVQATVVDGIADLAWLIGVMHQGQGFAAQAVRAMVDELESSSVHRFTAHVHRDHRRSQRVASAVGLEPIGAVDDDGEEIWGVTRRSLLTRSAADLPCVHALDHDSVFDGPPDSGQPPSPEPRQRSVILSMFGDQGPGHGIVSATRETSPRACDR